MKGLAAMQGLIQAQRGARVGARDDEEIRIFAGIRGNPDFVDHIFDRHNAPAWRMTAFLGNFLILNLNSRAACVLKPFDGVFDVEQTTEAGIGVTDQRCTGSTGNAAHALHHVGVCRNPGIRQAKVRRGNAVTRHIERLEADAVSHLGRDHVIDPGGEDDFAGADCRCQRCPFFSCVHVTGSLVNDWDDGSSRDLCGHACVPVGFRLIGVSQPVEVTLGEWPTGELETRWQTVFGKPARH